MYKQQTERTPSKCFGCGSVDYIIAKFPKSPKDIKNQICLNERVNCASQKEPYNVDNDDDQKIYAFMSQMSSHDKSSSRYFGKIL